MEAEIGDAAVARRDRVETLRMQTRRWPAALSRLSSRQYYACAKETAVIEQEIAERCAAAKLWIVCGAARSLSRHGGRQALRCRDRMGGDCHRPASFGWSAIQEGGKLCVLRRSLMRRVARGVALSEAELVRHAAHGPEHRLERLTFFSDAVFAIAITILVVDIHVPAIPDNATNLDWLKALLALAPELLSFGLSFIVIGSLWARHHATLSMLGKYDERLMWPNLFLLMSIAFLPFSTALLADGHGRLSPVPFAVYDVSLLIAGLLKTRLTYVAISGNLVLPHVTTAQIKAERRGSWILPIAATLALGLAFYCPAWNNLGLLSIVALRSLPYFAAPHVAKAAVGEMAEPRSGNG